MGLRLRGVTSITALTPAPKGRMGRNRRESRESWKLAEYERKSGTDEGGEQVCRERHWSDLAA